MNATRVKITWITLGTALFSVIVSIATIYNSRSSHNLEFSQALEQIFEFYSPVIVMIGAYLFSVKLQHGSDGDDQHPHGTEITKLRNTIALIASVLILSIPWATFGFVDKIADAIPIIEQYKTLTMSTLIGILTFYFSTD